MMCQLPGMRRHSSAAVTFSSKAFAQPGERTAA